MKPVEVIRSKVWRHKITKRTASTYGAHPYSGLPGDMRHDWELADVGWTTRNDNGTVGLCLRPFATAESMQAHVKKVWGIEVPINKR